MIPQYLSDELEAVQKLAAKIIFGNTSYRSLIESEEIELLSERRERSVLEFAKRALKNPKFGQKWFKPTDQTERSVRDSTRKRFVEANCRTERMRNNPVQYMVRALNNEKEQSGN